MEWLAANGATIAVLLCVASLLALAIRSLRRGSASCESCNGDCGGCAGSCSAPKIELTPAQEERLRRMRAKAGE